MGARLPSILTSEREETAARTEFIDDPAPLFAQMASTNLHWYCSQTSSWLNYADDTQSWSGFKSDDGTQQQIDGSWQPWTSVLDRQHAPVHRWFVGGQTNLCFNLVDRHVLGGRGDQTALIYEGDRWDPSKNDGRGGPVTEQHFTYRQLLEETVVRAKVLTDLGLARGDRIALNMPNIPEQIFYLLAAQRLGVLYTPVFGGFSAKTLSDRIHDAGAKVVITADGGYRNAEAVPYKSQ